MSKHSGHDTSQSIDPCLGPKAIAAYRQQHMKPLQLQAQASDRLQPTDSREKLKILRQQKLGRLTLIEAPNFWQRIHPDVHDHCLRPLLHLDYTASAQALAFLENYLIDCMRTYANTHTESSATGKHSTRRFQQALTMIKRHVHAPAKSFVLATGYGATGAIEKIQKILGLYLSPRAHKMVKEQVGIDLKTEMKKKYVVFVGPAEHHSNDVSWQDDALCDFVRIKAVKTGSEMNGVDLNDLEKQLLRFPDHIKIGSFSAASNVTGMKYQLATIGQILKRHQALFLVDYAASGPYENINMERDGIDAIFLSTHKNLGGTNLGLLVANESLYDLESNPSFGGGGTVTAVTPWEYHFHEAIEDREFPGTPAIRQVWQAALSFQIKEWIGYDTLHTMELRYCQDMMDFFQKHPRLQVLGNPDPKQRYPIFSFLVRHGDRNLHHTFVAALLNDIFGIQARSGCACAGPFGHELLGIEKELSDKYLAVIQSVLNGFKPGWTRIGAHYTLDQPELDYLKSALSAIAWFGAFFLDQYQFDPYTGDWQHLSGMNENNDFGLNQALQLGFQNGTQLSQLADESDLYQAFQNQLADFILLCAYKITQMLSRAAGIKLDQKQEQELAVQLTFPIREQIASPTTSEVEFCQKLADLVCPVIKPLSAAGSDCKADVIRQIDSVLFHPENHLHLYQSFNGLLKDVQFFYVWRNHVSPEIRQETLTKLGESGKICVPCVGPAN